MAKQYLNRISEFSSIGVNTDIYFNVLKLGNCSPHYPTIVTLTASKYTTNSIKLFFEIAVPGLESINGRNAEHNTVDRMDSDFDSSDNVYARLIGLLPSAGNTSYQLSLNYEGGREVVDWLFNLPVGRYVKHSKAAKLPIVR